MLTKDGERIPRQLTNIFYKTIALVDGAANEETEFMVKSKGGETMDKVYTLISEVCEGADFSKLEKSELSSEKREALIEALTTVKSFVGDLPEPQQAAIKSLVGMIGYQEKTSKDDSGVPDGGFLKAIENSLKEAQEQMSAFSEEQKAKMSELHETVKSISGRVKKIEELEDGETSEDLEESQKSRDDGVWSAGAFPSILNQRIENG